jgi:hypothetical protein
MRPSVMIFSGRFLCNVSFPRAFKLNGLNFWEITFYPPKVSIHFHFCLQSLKYDTLPPQTFKLWQLNPFSLFIPKMLPSLFFKKKKIFFFFLKKKKKKIQKICWGGRTTPSGPQGGSATP